MKPEDFAELGRVVGPVNAAHGLPNAFYTDPAVFEEEKRRLFVPGWAAIGFGKDVPEPGDARPVSLYGIPLLMVRDRTGALHVFQNVCRHRGMVLVDQPTRLKGVIRCPYHAWCYELDGALRATPHVGGAGHNTHADVDRDRLGLFEVRSHVFMDVVFVNISGDAAPFEQHAADLVARAGEFATARLHHGGPDSSFTLEVRTNWKLAVENYLESYHLPWVHPGLNSYSRLEDHYNVVETSFAGQGTLAYTPGFGPNGERFARFPGLAAKWDKGAEYPSFFPNVLFGFQNDHCFAIIVEPLAHDRSLERIEIYYASEAMTGPDFAAMRERNAAMWKSIFVEDIGVVEGMQRGRSAPGFDGGKFSPVMDTCTHRFHAWVAERFLAAA
ncbi:MAG: aromatic ring-hydroxylating dioxygenase subunit alpha [Hyphomicrobiaceae bacterium]